jgi:adenylosuccinate synthase
MMEDKMSSGGGGGGGGMDPNVAARLQKLETGGMDSALSAKMSEMEQKLKETQQKLENERKMTQDILNIAPKEPSQLEAWQKDAQIQWLKQMNEQLMQKITDSTKLIDEKMEQMKNMKVVGGGGGAVAVS